MRLSRIGCCGIAIWAGLSASDASGSTAAPTIGVVVDPRSALALLFDAETDRFIATVPVGAGERSARCSVSPDQNLAFITDGRNHVWVIDLLASPPALAAGTNPIFISDHGAGMAQSVDGRFLFVCGGEAFLSVIDVRRRVEVDAFYVGSACTTLEVCPDGSVLAASDETGAARQLLLDADGSLADTNASSCGHTLTVVDRIPPTLTPPEALTLECNTQGGVEAADARVRDWLSRSVVADRCGEAGVWLASEGKLGLGTTDAWIIGYDECGNRTEATSTITVVDTTPPLLSLSLAPSVLWPPDHSLRRVTAGLDASDVCGVPAVALASITSSEPDSASGSGDGNTNADVQGAALGTLDIEFLLRAERAASGDGRSYAIEYVATDESGNEARTRRFVVVPHDLRGGAPGPPAARDEDRATLRGKSRSSQPVDVKPK